MSSSDCKTAGATSRDLSPVEVELNSLHHNLDELEDMLRRLQSRLEPVSVAKPVGAPQGNPAPEPTLCLVAAGIRTESRRVGVLQCLAMKMIDELEV